MHYWNFPLLFFGWQRFYCPQISSQSHKFHKFGKLSSFLVLCRSQQINFLTLLKVISSPVTVSCTYRENFHCWSFEVGHTEGHRAHCGWKGFYYIIVRFLIRVVWDQVGGDYIVLLFYVYMLNRLCVGVI